MIRSRFRMVPRQGTAKMLRTGVRTTGPWGRFGVALAIVALSVAASGCGSEAPKAAEEAAKKPAETAVPDEFQSAASAVLGSDAQVLLFGDLAKNGRQQVLAANVLPNTPRSIVAGTIITRAVIAENDDGQWVELMRADEHLKNQKGFLALTPLTPVSGWKLQYESNPDQGMSLYFTPLKAGSSERTLPIAVRWNSANKRYQSMDPSYQHFLNEAPALQNPRSQLR